MPDLVPVDYDPFGENPDAPQLVPVDHDPDNPPAGPQLIPVDHDPFATPKPGKTVPPPDMGQAAARVPRQMVDWAGRLSGFTDVANAARNGGTWTDVAGTAVPLAIAAVQPEARGAGKAIEAAEEAAPTALRSFGFDEAARNARADAQGFTTPAYRGATRPEPSDPGSLFGRPYTSWSTDSPELASEYAGGNAPLGNNPRVFVQGRGWSPLQGNVQPQVLDTSNYHVVDAGGRGIDQVRAAALADARLRGKQGVVIENVYDEPGEGGGSSAGSKLGKPTTVYATFDPATRRSRFANFDPSKLGSRDLLAGLAPFGVLGAMSAPTSKSQ